MFIQTEQTPNPETLKFIPGCIVLEATTAAFTKQEEASRSPLAQRLFQIDGVTGVFLGEDFISVSKDRGKDWTILKPPILGAIMEHFTAGHPVLLADTPSSKNTPDGEEQDGHQDTADNAITTQIKELLDTRIRPAVAMDGGDIVFSQYDNGIVYLKLQGACSGCPSSTATLKMGIENMLRHYIPEVTEVRAVE